MDLFVNNLHKTFCNRKNICIPLNIIIIICCSFTHKNTKHDNALYEHYHLHCNFCIYVLCNLNAFFI